MAQYTIDVPSALSVTLVAAVREHFDEDVDGMSDIDAVKHAIKESLKPIVKGYSLRHADSQAVQDAEAAIATAQTAAATAQQARKDAETTALTQVDTDFGGIS